MVLFSSGDKHMRISPPTYHGFSLVEILIITAVLAIVSTVAVPLITGVPDAAKKKKLEQDVAIVNNAIDAYLSAGGNPEALTQSGLLGALKSRVSSGITAEMLGPQGPFIDTSITTNATDFSWSAVFTPGTKPRFVVVQTTNGVTFDKGPAMAIGGEAERPDAARPSWLWSYADVTASTDNESFTPLAVDSISASPNLPQAGITLSPPLVSPESQVSQIWGYPLTIQLSNPNPARSSRIYYKIGTGNFSLYEDGSALSIGPDSSLVAVCVSLDPTRFYNSTAVSNFYGVIPLQLAVKVNTPSTVNYAQAGGLFQGVSQLQPVNATITLEDGNDNLTVKTGEDDKFIPSPYLRSEDFVVKYTIDGSDPFVNGTMGPTFQGFYNPVSIPLNLAAWGTNSTITIRAIAISANTALFTTSPEDSATSSVDPTPVTVAIVPSNPIGLPFQVLINDSGATPVGSRKFYTVNGNPPLTSLSGGFPSAGALAYSSPIPSTSLPRTTYQFTAQAMGPAGSEHWFSSPINSKTYTTLTVLNPSLVGASISGGDVNGSFRGSIFVAAPANLGIFNAGGQVVNGNLYVPGLPAIEIPGSGNSTKTVVQRGATFVDSPGLISRTLIAGKEISATGVLANPQLDLRQVVDLNGSSSPTNYTIKLTKNSFIEGKIYRNVDVPPPPPTPIVPQGLTLTTNSVTGLPATNLPSGIYSNRITMNSSSSVIRLGTPGSTTTQYIFHGNTFNKGTVEILGPVEIYFTSGWTNSGVVFGPTNNTSLLRINVMGGDVDLKSGGAMYGNLWATNDVSVGNGGILFGSIFAQYLNVAPGGTVNVEP